MILTAKANPPITRKILKTRVKPLKPKRILTLKSSPLMARRILTARTNLPRTKRMLPVEARPRMRTPKKFSTSV